MEINPLDRQGVINKIKTISRKLRAERMKKLAKRSPLMNSNGNMKMRGLDGTMFGPFRSSSRWVELED